MRLPVRSSVVALLAVAALSATAAAPVAPTFQIFDAEDAVDCTQFVPRQTPEVSGVTDSGADVLLDVHILLDVADGLPVATALRDAVTSEEKSAADAAMAALVAKYRPKVTAGNISYDELDVQYSLTFGLFAPFEANGTPRNRTTAAARESQTMINRAKTQFGGKRPAGSDVVYVLTDLNIYANGIGDGVVGQADCIGGVEWADRAFAVGEIFPGIKIGPTEFYREGTAKVMAHEIGHLMGAHHHYQSCGTPAVGEAQAGGVGACTIMTNAVDFTTFEFSLLNGGIVRANAVDFAN